MLYRGYKCECTVFFPLTLQVYPPTAHFKFTSRQKNISSILQEMGQTVLRDPHTESQTNPAVPTVHTSYMLHKTVKKTRIILPHSTRSLWAYNLMNFKHLIIIPQPILQLSLPKSQAPSIEYLDPSGILFKQEPKNPKPKTLTSHFTGTL